MLALGNDSFHTASATEIQDSLSVLPEKWFGSISSVLIQKENLLALPVCLLFFFRLVSKSKIYQEAKLKFVIDYLVRVMEKQTILEIIRDPLIVQSNAFKMDSIGSILRDILFLLELECGPESLPYAIDSLLFLLNRSSKEDKIYNRLCVGFSSSIRSSDHPLLYLASVCRSASSPEQMALWSEDSITRYLEIFNHSSAWDNVIAELKVPELDESTFIRSCISHGLIYTLYAHSLSRLNTAVNVEKIMIGEQIAVWIESIQLESCPNPRYFWFTYISKIALMIVQYTNLLNYEMSNNADSSHYRLSALLEPIQDTLFKWSNTPSLSLWSALGFTKHSTIPANVRLFCRFMASFIASRLLESDKDAERMKLAEAFEGFLTQQEFADHIDVTEEMKSAFHSKSTILELNEFARRYCTLLFPSVSAHVYL